MNSQTTAYYQSQEGLVEYAWLFLIDLQTDEHADYWLDFAAQQGERYGRLEGNPLFTKGAKP